MTFPRVKLKMITGLMEGSLERFPVTLLAEQGDSLEIEATLFVAMTGIGRTFWGILGFCSEFN